MKNRCAIISGGKFSPPEKIESCGFVIACDRGVEYALKCGITPDLIVGDFDSYKGKLPDGVPVLRLQVEKDYTDTQVAVDYAVKNGYKEIFLYCALGGRLDHLFGNIQSCVYAVKNGARVSVIDENDYIYCFGNSSLTVPVMKGRSLSVIALTDKVKNVSIDGTKYKLKDAVITNSLTIGVSNEWESDAVISAGEGVLAVILSKLGDDDND